jgi:hypothetical protein
MDSMKDDFKNVVECLWSCAVDLEHQSKKDDILSKRAALQYQELCKKLQKKYPALL